MIPSVAEYGLHGAPQREVSVARPCAYFLQGCALQGNAAWVPLGDLGTLFIRAGLREAGGYVADDAVNVWMTSTGMTQEP